MPTILHRLARWASENPDAPAQSYKNPVKGSAKGVAQGDWNTLSAREYRDRVYYMALYLESMGVGPGDGSCIFSPNCFQWTHVDLAVLLLGGRSAGIYPNSIPKDVLYILQHADAKVFSVQNKDFYAKAVASDEGRALVEALPVLLSFAADTSFSPKAVSYDAAIAKGRELSQRPGAKTFQQYLDALDPKAGAFMVYTSGTTGNPKGALLSQDNLCFTSDQVMNAWHLPHGPGQRLFSFLPLCHVAEKLHSVGVAISARYHVYFCSKFELVSVELPQAEPTLLLCVPRIWEKMMEGVNNKLRNAPPLKKKLVAWGLGAGERVSAARLAGKLVNPLDLVQFKIADRLILSKIKQALGLRQATLLASGAAALPAHVSRWFRKLGFEIQDCLGQTETTGMICLTEPGVDSIGRVGRPLPGTEMQIAEDGEILTRGRQVFVGYFKDPAATAQALEGGWLHSGDIGELDDRGLLMVRGRKKEVMKTSGGKMIAPLPLEEMIKAAPFVSNACLVGDGRKYIAALITLNAEALKGIQPGAIGAQVITDSGITAQLKAHIAKINQGLAAYEQIKRFAILANEFSIESGEMTPTLKMKRAIIEKRYAPVIDSLYSGGGAD